MMEMDKPFISVLIPAYNSEQYIRKALDSVRCQTFTDYELIVVCDTCYDRTRAVAEEYGARTNDVSFNLDGLTRNAGIDMAQGEYILFLDDDDWYTTNEAFQTLWHVAQQNEYPDAVMFSYTVNDERIVEQRPDNISVHVWSKLWKRSFIGDTRFSFRRSWSDADFHNRMMKKPHRFAYTNTEPLMRWNFMRPGSQTEQVINGKMVRPVNPPPAISVDYCWKGDSDA